MLIGNKQGKNALHLFFQKAQEIGKIPFPFLLVDGPQYVGKTTVIESHIQHLLESFFALDYKPLYDFSDFLEKKHRLKVEVPAKDQQIEISGKLYPNLGARDVIQWFSIAPMGKWKVLFIENIERMTPQATNSLLKTLEEPLSGRLVIATTTNKESLLDTLLSRAFIISFQMPDIKELDLALERWYPEVNNTMRLFVSRFSLGRVGLAKKLLDNPEEIEEYATLFQRLLVLLKDDTGGVTEKYKIFQKFLERGSIEHLIDALVYSLVETTDRKYIYPLLAGRRLLNSNVGKDNILFSLSI